MKNNAMTKHEMFILNTILPATVNHAHRIGVQTDEAALAVLLAMSTILQERGFTDAVLIKAIRASALTTHDAPEAMQ